MENKFNFSDDNFPKENLDRSISNNAKGLFHSLISFFKEVLDFRKEADKDSTINSIKNDKKKSVSRKRIITNTLSSRVNN